MTVRVKFEPRDLWVGVFVDKSWWEGGRRWHRLYVCLLPTLPIVIAWRD